MKPTLLILLSILLFSCVTTYPYRYYTVSSEQAVKNDYHDLVFENDTLRLIYRFSNYPRELTLTVFNKTAHPIEINWKKSALILGDYPLGYYSPEKRINGKMDLDSARTIFSRSRTAKFDATVIEDDALQFLPPFTAVTKGLREIPPPSRSLKNLPFDKATAQKLKTQNSYFKYKKLSYDPVASPLKFRSFLTIYWGPSQEVFLDHSFYISEIWLSDQGPSFMPSAIRKNGDRFRF